MEKQFVQHWRYIHMMHLGDGVAWMIEQPGRDVRPIVVWSGRIPNEMRTRIALAARPHVAGAR